VLQTGRLSSRPNAGLENPANGDWTFFGVANPPGSAGVSPAPERPEAAPMACSHDCGRDARAPRVAAHKHSALGSGDTDCQIPDKEDIGV